MILISIFITTVNSKHNVLLLFYLTPSCSGSRYNINILNQCSSCIDSDWLRGIRYNMSLPCTILVILLEEHNHKCQFLGIMLYFVSFHIIVCRTYQTVSIGHVTNISIVGVNIQFVCRRKHTIPEELSNFIKN